MSTVYGINIENLCFYIMSNQRFKDFYHINLGVKMLYSSFKITLFHFTKLYADYLYYIKNNDEELNNVLTVIKENDKYKMIRDDYTKLYSWPIISKKLCLDISKFLNTEKIKTCLSVMSGNGYLEKSLIELNCDIISTDINALKHNLNNVLQKDAITAILEYDKDVLLISWPPYEDNNIEEVLKLALQIGYKYIIYIGEFYGCCATEKFFNILYKMTNEITEIKINNFHHIYDRCVIFSSKLKQINTKYIKNHLINKKICNFISNNKTLKNKKIKKLIYKYFKIKLNKKHINFVKSLS